MNPRNHLCTECKHYDPKRDEHSDICLHPKAEHGGVRAHANFTCASMRVGICGLQADLFEPRLKAVS